jgi:hypothetical protein
MSCIGSNDYFDWRLGAASLLQHEILVDVRSGSKPENLSASICFPLFIQ